MRAGDRLGPLLGVDGFALHCACSDRDVTGVEASPEAVTSARTSARQSGLRRVRFEVGDATAFATSATPVPDLVIVNPPRRGIGADLCNWLAASPVRHLVYSSCNVESLARDLSHLPSLRPRRARLLDIFAHTRHYEVATLLERG